MCPSSENLSPLCKVLPTITKGHAHQPNPVNVWLGIGLIASYSWMGLNQISQPAKPGSILPAVIPNAWQTLLAHPTTTTTRL